MVCFRCIADILQVRLNRLQIILGITLQISVLLAILNRTKRARYAGKLGRLNHLSLVVPSSAPLHHRYPKLMTPTHPKPLPLHPAQPLQSTRLYKLNFQKPTRKPSLNLHRKWLFGQGNLQGMVRHKYKYKISK